MAAREDRARILPVLNRAVPLIVIVCGAASFLHMVRKFVMVKNDNGAMQLAAEQMAPVIQIAQAGYGRIKRHPLALDHAPNKKRTYTKKSIRR